MILEISEFAVPTDRNIPVISAAQVIFAKAEITNVLKSANQMQENAMQQNAEADHMPNAAIR